MLSKTNYVHNLLISTGGICKITDDNGNIIAEIEPPQQVKQKTVRAFAKYILNTL